MGLCLCIQIYRIIRTPSRFQGKKAEWLARGHGQLDDVEEKEFFKVGTGDEMGVC